MPISLLFSTLIKAISSYFLVYLKHKLGVRSVRWDILELQLLVKQENFIFWV